MIGVIERDILVEKERVRLQVVVRLGFFVFLERGLAFPSEGEGPRFGGEGTYLRQLVQNRWLFVFIELENGHRRAGNETQHCGAEAGSRGVIWEIEIRGIFQLGGGG